MSVASVPLALVVPLRLRRMASSLARVVTSSVHTTIMVVTSVVAISSVVATSVVVTSSVVVISVVAINSRMVNRRVASNSRVVSSLVRAVTSSVVAISTIIAERFTEKKLIVPLHVKNAPEGYKIRLFPKEVEVNVRVGMTHFAQVQVSDITATCTYSPDRKETMDVELYYTNPYITFAWTYPGVVEYLLEQ